MNNTRKIDLFDRMTSGLKHSTTALHEDGLQMVRHFVQHNLHEYGGFCGHNNTPDLYYTTFGIECAATLGIKMDWSKIRDFIARYGRGEEFDLVHLFYLTHCWHRLEEITNGEIKDPFAGPVVRELLAPFAAAQGGYNRGIGMERGLVYETFLALAALEEHGQELPPADEIFHILGELKTRWGGYANHRGLRIGTTAITSATMALLLRYDHTAEATDALQWIKTNLHEKGGILVNDTSIIPDMLSTAMGLTAMEMLHSPYPETWIEKTLDFVSSLWESDGGFCGHVVDKRSDLEYTFYALVVLGILNSKKKA